MHPKIFSIQIPYTNVILPIYSYGVFVFIGICAAFILTLYRARQQNLDLDIMFGFLILIVISGFIGSRILLLIAQWSYFLADPIYMIKNVGMTIPGGIIGGIILTALYIRYYWDPKFSNGKRMSFWWMADICAPGIVLGESLGRIGCLLGGCCYGKPTSLPWNISYTIEVPRMNYSHALISVHPTQIYHSISGFLIFVVLLVFEKKIKRPYRTYGKTFLVFLLLYSLFRFIIEIFRGDNRGFLIIGHITITQLICLVVMIFGMAVIFSPRMAKMLNIYSKNMLKAEECD